MVKAFAYIIMRCMRGFYRYKKTSNPKKYSTNLSSYMILNPFTNELVIDAVTGRAKLFDSYKQAKCWIDKRYIAEEL